MVVTLNEVIKLLAYNMVDSSLSFIDLNQFAVTATSFGKILLTYTCLHSISENETSKHLIIKINFLIYCN